MVSNEEISEKLKDKRKRKSLNGYLVCNNCGGYYELQPGESWKDPQNLQKSKIFER